jgi:hypothetical protein
MSARANGSSVIRSFQFLGLQRGSGTHALVHVQHTWDMGGGAGAAILDVEPIDGIIEEDVAGRCYGDDL